MIYRFFSVLARAKFGFELLGNAWKNPYNRREIEEYIRAWLVRKLKKRSVEEAMVVILNIWLMFTIS